MIYNTYLFDMDGTLLDTLADLTAAVNHTLERYGYPRRTIEQVRKGLGNGAVKLMAAMLPQGEETPGFADIMRDTERGIRHTPAWRPVRIPAYRSC